MSFITHKNKGFTLIELMVSMSIFMIVMIMALGSLVNISNVSKKSRSLHQAMDNLNFAMESMTRSLRTGSNYDCNSIVSIGSDSVWSNCPSGAGSISFISQNNTSSFKDVAYTLSNGSLQKCFLNNFNNTECVDMTSSDVSVDNLMFYVNGADPADNFQPSVYIVMKGSVSIGKEKTDFSLQTFVSQRNTE